MSNFHRPSVPSSSRSSIRRPSQLGNSTNNNNLNASSSSSSSRSPSSSVAPTRTPTSLNSTSNSNTNHHLSVAAAAAAAVAAAQSKKFAKLEQYTFPDELSESMDASLLLKELDGSGATHQFNPPDEDEELEMMIANAQKKKPSLVPMSKYNPFVTARRGLTSSSAPPIQAQAQQQQQTSRKNDNNSNHQRSVSSTSATPSSSPHPNTNNNNINSPSSMNRFSAFAPQIEELPEELLEDSLSNQTENNNNNNNNTSNLHVLGAAQVESDHDDDDEDEKDALRFMTQHKKSSISSSSGPPPLNNVHHRDSTSSTEVPSQRLQRAASRIGKIFSEIKDPVEEEPKGFSSICLPSNQSQPQQQRKRPLSLVKNNPNVYFGFDDGNGNKNNEDDFLQSQQQQPLWPELPMHLRQSICITDSEYKQQLQDLYARVEPSAHVAHQFGVSPHEELDENDFNSSSSSSSASSTSTKKNHHQGSSSHNNNNDDEEIEEMMETIEAGPKKSKTHAVVAPATVAPRKMYYFEQKQILDAQAATLEQAAPAVVSAAVRASQSPFSPWCSYHQDALETVGGHAIVQEVQRLLDEGATTSAADVGASIMATPLGFNVAWRTAGVSIDAETFDHLVLTPAVAVPNAIINRRDAALDMGMFKSVVIRGIPKFERGVQTTLTAFHENSMWFTISRNALQQQEQIARMSITSERSFAVMHFTMLEHHGRDVAKWNTDLIAKRPTNVLALYLAQIREKKGEKKMLQNLLTVPTSDGRLLSQVLEEDQKEVFDNAIELAQHLIDTTIATSVPILELIKMEQEVREQQSRSYYAWAGSMEYRSALIRMSYVKRCSSKVKHSLRTSTVLDEKIAAMNAALARISPSIENADQK